MPKRIFIGAVAFTALFSVSCANMGDSSLEERVAQQDMRIRQIQPQQADAMNQIQAMRQEINELKGKLNAMSNGARPGETPSPQDSPLYQNTTMRSEQTYIAPGAAIPSHSPGIQSAGAPDSSAYASQAPNPTPMTGEPASYGLPAETGAQAYQTEPAPSEATWGQADPKPEIQVPQKDLSLALFDAGVNSYNSRKYAEAERSFSDLLKNYPNHSQSAEAQYYIGECQFQTNNFPQAALSYENVIKKYPKSSVAAGAYLKQAICFSKMDQKAAARARMQEILSKFPNSPEAARAKSFLKSNK